MAGASRRSGELLTFCGSTVGLLPGDPDRTTMERLTGRTEVSMMHSCFLPHARGFVFRRHQKGLSMRTGSIVTVTILVAVSLVPTLATAADGLFEISKRYRVETGPESGRYHALTKTESWDPKATAVIVCDVWDVHHSLNAVRRVKQIAPRINELLKHARQRGALIIHAPSGCVDFYKDHPARQQARSVPPVSYTHLRAHETDS